MACVPYVDNFTNGMDGDFKKQEGRGWILSQHEGGIWGILLAHPTLCRRPHANHGGETSSPTPPPLRGEDKITPRQPLLSFF